LVNRIDVVRDHRRTQSFSMTLIRITGSQLHAARVLVGLSRDTVAELAGLCRHSIRKWETSSDAIPGAMYTHLIRVVDVLEDAGVRFSKDGVRLHRPSPVSTVLHSNGAMA
jgi:DNA-binding transcriptional regulator YiaG